MDIKAVQSVLLIKLFMMTDIVLHCTAIALYSLSILFTPCIFAHFPWRNEGM